ncbi:MAG: hypothetical protein Q4G66_02360 [bacterium]|nr:hypothetical protein [bacterium]
MAVFVALMDQIPALPPSTQDLIQGIQNQFCFHGMFDPPANKAAAGNSNNKINTGTNSAAEAELQLPILFLLPARNRSRGVYFVSI